MKYYRCKCGKREAWGSMPPGRCVSCQDCGTTLDTSPDQHTAPRPHNFSESTVRTDEGLKTITTCSGCMKPKWQIEQEEQAKQEPTSILGYYQAQASPKDLDAKKTSGVAIQEKVRIAEGLTLNEE